MPKKLISPDDLLLLLTRRFDNQHRNWLTGKGQWPLSMALGMPMERDVIDDAAAVRSWVEAWSSWRGPGELQWEERQWSRLGKQRLPAAVQFSSAAQVATAVRQGERWERAVSRYASLTRRWPALADTPQLVRNFDVLADYAEEDFDRLFALLAWLEANPDSGLYARQLPVAGLDTKWMERRRGLVVDLMQAIHDRGAERDFHALCGLRKPSHRLRLRVLCPALRASIGGLTDIEAPLEELAGLAINPRFAVVVENLETGMALPDMEGAVAFMKLGHAVGALAGLPWLRELPGVYWGDIDTHGLAILSRARAAMPKLISMMMDEKTLLSHRHLWVEEPVQNSDVLPKLLTAEEAALYQGLREQRWGYNVRLEQERIAWTDAMETIAQVSSHS
ncbi:MAG TPA: DUF3322 domain-containing protein [Burkholderiaceae bacterium]